SRWTATSMPLVLQASIYSAGRVGPAQQLEGTCAIELLRVSQLVDAKESAHVRQVIKAERAEIFCAEVIGWGRGTKLLLNTVRVPTQGDGPEERAPVRDAPAPGNRTEEIVSVTGDVPRERCGCGSNESRLECAVRLELERDEKGAAHDRRLEKRR